MLFRSVVDRLHAYEFEWNDHPENVACHRQGTKSVGVIAQDVEASGAADCVIQRLSDSEDSLLAVDYVKLVPYLIESIRGLRRELTELKSTKRKRRNGATRITKQKR